MMLVTARLADTDLLILPATLIIGLISLSAVHYATLKWYTLFGVALLTLVPYIPINIRNQWLRLVAQLIIMAPLVAGAAYFALDTASESYY